jgi:hypothetical protein
LILGEGVAEDCWRAVASSLLGFFNPSGSSPQNTRPASRTAAREPSAASGGSSAERDVRPPLLADFEPPELLGFLPARPPAGGCALEGVRRAELEALDCFDFTGAMFTGAARRYLNCIWAMIL